MCESCDMSHEEQWQKQSSKRSNTRQVLGDLIEKASTVLDFYYDVDIDRSDREITIKLDLETALTEAQKYHADL